jgi:FtsP/CotA-like multicopper oxidase with cupredoxin domain
LVIKKPGTVFRFLILFAAAALAASAEARAEGIAVSTDGLVWTQGAGAYGKGWNYAGQGVSVRQGDTVYVRYFSPNPGVALHFTEHGRRWGGWPTMGPQLIDNIGLTHDFPVVLRISKIGTPECTITWLNGRGTSGLWSGMTTPGPYDLALHGEAKWTLPPIVVNEAPKPRGFWAQLASWLNPPSEPTDGIVSVPDNGLTAGLLAFSLTLLLMVRRRPH